MPRAKEIFLCAIGWPAMLYMVDHMCIEFQTAPGLPDSN
jgi:hypothetical protein